ncbi:hypothetical protein GCM10011316_32830 [Roseibium aquae]|uniref:PNPLA domain-containing protein n=1 Tax=Roseibium aquae TaxID=1323746 RepID=A0A916X1P0_9HYPH|nr:patatin-like protein [Roseibium aquae]GGB58217.1 hypothetical protein GCM10011316_32830 [Roseibium aquae]
MKEIELRLALIFYGGVSLAIYMHGVSREVLNLVRASAKRSARPNAAIDAPQAPLARSEAEVAYGRLLEAVGRSVEVKVVTDAIAGASAGGVNGIMLARAIAHDLPIDGHRDFWLENADVTRLARKQNGFARYLKSGMSPMLDRVVAAQLKREVDEPETREKLRHFMQSRWFTPPFSGEAFIGWMLDACTGMEDHGPPAGTLIPQGQSLDLFVTITDYTGRRRRIRIDNPAFIEEWDHRKILKFQASHRAAGGLDSEFGSDRVADLVFAARATASFPGAFYPATIAEMDRVLQDRGEEWPNREAFVRDRLDLTGTHRERHCFVDGSVVMNKPFAPVVEAIQHRPASREVARRLVYVDPVPPSQSRSGVSTEELPGFFKVIFASMAHIPRNEPIGDELRDIEARNRRSRWLARTITAADPVVEKAVRRIMPLRMRMKPGAVTRCRKKANEAAHAKAGFAFLNYQALKLHAVAEQLSDLALRLARGQGMDLSETDLAPRIHQQFEAHTNGVLEAPLRPDAAVIGVLRRFDIDYRIRRLRFAVRKLNTYYNAPDPDRPKAEDLDRLKSRIYAQIDSLTIRWSKAFYNGEVAGLAAALVSCGTCDQGTPDASSPTLSAFLDKVGDHMAMEAHDEQVDAFFAQEAAEGLEGAWYRGLIEAYVGYAFYDLVIFPVLQRNDFSEVVETLVDRISPEDCRDLSPNGLGLKGKALNSFGAFFNRSWREHDYLWGRLNAAERLVSILLSASPDIVLPEKEIWEIKRGLFEAILNEDSAHLPAMGAEIEAIRARMSAWDEGATVEEEAPGPFHIGESVV